MFFLIAAFALGIASLQFFSNLPALTYCLCILMVIAVGWCFSPAESKKIIMPRSKSVVMSLFLFKVRKLPKGGNK